MESSASVPLADCQKLKFAYDFMGRRYSKKVDAYNATTSEFDLQPMPIRLTHYRTLSGARCAHFCGQPHHGWYSGANRIGMLQTTFLYDG